MGRPSNTAARRREIVDALRRVMARHGYARASVAAIADEAGLAPGLVHYHFPSKQAVLLALVEQLGCRVEARFETMSAGAPTPRAMLMAFLDAHLARGPGADPDAVACWVALGAEALAEPEVRAAYTAVVRREMDRLEELVRATLAAEGGAAEAAPRIAAGLFAAIEGAFRLASIGPGFVPEGSAAGTLRQMAAGLLRAAGATQPNEEEAT